MKKQHRKEKEQRKNVTPTIKSQPTTKVDYSKKNNIQIKQPIPYEENLILSHESQRKNPSINFIDKQIKLEFLPKIIPDFIINERIAIFYLGLNFYMKSPNFYVKNLEGSKKLFKIKFLIIHVDVQKNINYIERLNEVQRIGSRNKFTCIVCFSFKEVGKYISLIKRYEKQSVSVLTARVEDEYLPRVNDVLTSIKSINKTDVKTLLTNFSSLRKIVKAKHEDLLICAGIGRNKVNNLYKTFHAPLKKKKMKQTKLKGLI